MNTITKLYIINQLNNEHRFQAPWVQILYSFCITDISAILKVSLIEKPFIRELHQTVHFSRCNHWYGDQNFDVFLKTEIIKWQWKQQWLWSWPFFSKPSGMVFVEDFVKILINWRWWSRYNQGWKSNGVPWGLFYHNHDHADEMMAMITISSGLATE